MMISHAADSRVSESSGAKVKYIFRAFPKCLRLVQDSTFSRPLSSLASRGVEREGKKHGQLLWEE